MSPAHEGVASRRFGVGFRTLLYKETKRFLRVPGQTLLAPVITTLLYFVVFGVSLGGQLKGAHGVPYARYIVPGLVMLPLISNAFLNTSSSLFQGKIMGTIVDMLVAPLADAEILAAYLVAATARALAVGVAVWLVGAGFTGFEVAHPAWVLGFALLTSLAFAACGVIAAIVSDKFEQINIFPTFVITPLTFLGGVFYSIDRLPPLWRTVARCNPVLYMVEGLRYGFIGASDVPPTVGLAILLVLAAASSGIAWLILRTGYKLRG